MTEDTVILPSFVHLTNKSKTTFSEFHNAPVPGSIRMRWGRFSLVQALCRRVHRSADRWVPEPCCLGAAVHTLIWLLKTSTFHQTALTAILFTRAAAHRGEISLSALLAKLVFAQTLFFPNLLQTAKRSQTCQQAASNPTKKHSFHTV